MPDKSHFNGKTFFNPAGGSAKGLGAVLRWMLSRERTRWPGSVVNPPFPPPPAPQPGQLVVTFINHSTFLCQTANLTVLTDPIFSQRASPVQFAGPKRVRLPGIPLECLPKIDLIVQSHDHYDHMDLGSLAFLANRDRPHVITTVGNRARLARVGLQDVDELDWWNKTRGSGLSVTCVPAQHFSGRGLFDRNETLWAGFFLETENHNILFAGDSGYGDHYAEMRERLGRIDVAFLPIGAYRPRWFMSAIHMDPQAAVRAHLDLAAALSIGMHFGTFQLTDEGIDEPAAELLAGLRAANVDPRSFRVLGFGESLVL